MRVVHLVSRSQGRGAEIAAVELANELTFLGHDNRLMAIGLAFDGSQDPRLPPLIYTEELKARTLLRSIRRLRTELKREPADVLIAHGGWAAQVAALSGSADGPALVWQRILGFPPNLWKFPRRWWWSMVARRFDAGIALTSDMKRELRQLHFTRQVWIIPNARRPARFVAVDRAAAGAALRRRIGVPADVPILGLVGHLVAQKQPHRAVDVLKDVLSREQPAHLVIVGDGPVRPAVEQYVRSARLEHAVTFLGQRSDVEHIFGGIDLLLLTSDAEGIPGAVIEAQMTGCPVISFPVGGIKEIVEDGVSGVVVDQPSVSLMGEAVVKLFRDDTARLAMGEAARRRTPDFSMTKTADVYAERFGDLVMKRRAAQALAKVPSSARPRD
jgi:glycosyltransferase involved in cell wall biosynthesis